MRAPSGKSFSHRGLSHRKVRNSLERRELCTLVCTVSFCRIRVGSMIQRIEWRDSKGEKEKERGRENGDGRYMGRRSRSPIRNRLSLQPPLLEKRGMEGVFYMAIVAGTARSSSADRRSRWRFEDSPRYLRVPSRTSRHSYAPVSKFSFPIVFAARCIAHSRWRTDNEHRIFEETTLEIAAMINHKMP